MVDDPRADVAIDLAQREPVRKAGLTTALYTLLVYAGVRLAKLDPPVAAQLAGALAPLIAAEIGRRFAISPATAARALAGDQDVTEEAVKAIARDPSWLRRYWPGFLALAALAFAAPETIAITSDGTGGTLSEWTRDQLGTSSGALTAGWWAVTAGLAVFTVWFSGHLVKFWPWEREDRRPADVG